MLLPLVLFIPPGHGAQHWTGAVAFDLHSMLHGRWPCFMEEEAEP
jgi:hypothetical protein